MRISRILFRIALSLLPITVLSTVWLYLYPIFHSCAFPAVSHSSHVPSVAPFRLLALGDPQLEGDSSLPDPNALIFPSVNDLIQDLRDASSLLEQRDILALAGSGVVKDAVNWLKGKRKAVDLWGNDWYLAHIVRSLRWWTEPTHISVLGDLLGSQWITDGEFEKRAGRYWNIVMHGLGNVPRAVFGHEKEDISEDANGRLTSSILEGTEQMEEPNISDAKERSRAPEEGDIFDEMVEEPSTSKAERSRLWGGTTEILGASTSWSTRVINIAGNHDVGYAGDIDETRIDRFERAFGSVNWDIWFTLPSTDLNETETVTSHEGRPALRIVVLNSMNLDTPAWTPELQTETYEFLNHIITTSRPVEDKTHATLLLTHIPLEKEAGICVDSPYFDFFEGGQGVKEQNMLSDHASKIILEGIFGMSSNKDVAGQGQGRRGFVINGHDHAGCDVMHYIRQPAASNKCNTTLVQSHEAYWPPNTKVDGTTATTTLGDFPAETCPALRNDTSHREQCEITPEAEISEEIGDTTEKMDAPPKWKARRFPPLPYDINEKSECTSIHEAPHIREVTLRSMMGEYSGYAGFLAAWFDETLGEKGEWVFEFATCGLGIQHWWWAVHIIWLVLIIAVMAGCVTNLLEATVLRKTSTSDNTFVGVTSRTVSSAQRSHGDHKHMGGRSAGQRLSSSPVR